MTAARRPAQGRGLAAKASAGDSAALPIEQATSGAGGVDATARPSATPPGNRTCSRVGRQAPNPARAAGQYLGLVAAAGKGQHPHIQPGPSEGALDGEAPVAQPPQVDAGVRVCGDQDLTVVAEGRRDRRSRQVPEPPPWHPGPWQSSGCRPGLGSGCPWPPGGGRARPPVRASGPAGNCRGLCPSRRRRAGCDAAPPAPGPRHPGPKGPLR